MKEQKLIKVALYNNENYIVNSSKNTFFVYGEGYIKSSLKNIHLIPYYFKFDKNDNFSSLEFISDHIKKNEKYFNNYVKNYGIKIIQEQLGLQKDEYTSQSYFYLQHMSIYPDLKNYIENIKEIYNEIIKIVEKNEDKFVFYDSFRKNLDLEKIIKYDEIENDWNIRLFNSTTDEPTYIEKIKSILSKETNNITFKDFFNSLSNNLGDKIENNINFKQYLINNNLFEKFLETTIELNNQNKRKITKNNKNELNF